MDTETIKKPIIYENEKEIIATAKLSKFFPTIDLGFLTMGEPYKGFEARGQWFDVPVPKWKDFLFDGKQFLPSQWQMELEYRFYERAFSGHTENYRPRLVSSVGNNQHLFRWEKRIETDPLLKTNQQGEERFDIRATFDGILPSTIKDKIKLAQDNMASEIYLVSDEPQWKAAPSIVGDPLIIAKTNFGNFLVGKFNCTTIEEYISREFTTAKGIENERE